LVSWLKSNADQKLQAAIESRHYGASDLLEISAPVNLPYTTNWADWESVEGQIVIGGYHYNYVERRLHDGVMTYRCLANTEKQNLLTARDAFFKLAGDFENASAPDSKKSSSKISISNYIGDYDDCATAFLVNAGLDIQNQSYIQINAGLQNGFNGLSSPPPKC